MDQTVTEVLRMQFKGGEDCPLCTGTISGDTRGYVLCMKCGLVLLSQRFHTPSAEPLKDYDILDQKSVELRLLSVKSHSTEAAQL